MFNKKELQYLRGKIFEIEEALNGREYYSTYEGETKKFSSGLIDKIGKLETENKKLKAVVAELCNYVYETKKGAKK